MPTFATLATPAVLVDLAKLGEAEAMLPTGVRSLFVAHSLVDAGQAPRTAALADQLDDFRVAATSEAQADALVRIAAAAGRKLGVMLAVDTGLGREGAREAAMAGRIAARLVRSSQLELRGLHTHEGPGLALIDAGSKTFSSDRTPDGISARAADGRDLAVVRVNEEHSDLRGSAVGALQIGECIIFTPAHVCTVVNLTDSVIVTEGGQPVDAWRGEARGRTQ